jgi:hypothetical protein
MPHTASRGAWRRVWGWSATGASGSQNNGAGGSQINNMHSKLPSDQPQLSCRSATSLYTPGSARPPVVSCESRHTRCCTCCTMECVRDQARARKRARQTSSAGASQSMHTPQAQQCVGGQPATSSVRGLGMRAVHCLPCALTHHATRPGCQSTRQTAAQGAPPPRTAARSPDQPQAPAAQRQPLPAGHARPAAPPAACPAGTGAQVGRPC